VRLLHWGGAPYEPCICGHSRLSHVGSGGLDNQGTSRLELNKRERGCGAVIGTNWCHCDRYRPESDYSTLPDYVRARGRSSNYPPQLDSRVPLAPREEG